MMYRWENAPTTRELVRLTGALVDIYCASYPAPPAAVIAKLTTTTRHRLRSLAVSRTDQTCDIGRTRPHPGLMPQRRQKWRQPNRQIAAPILCHRQPP